MDDDIVEITFFVPGRPVPQPRMTARGVRTKNHRDASRHERYLNYRSEVGWRAKQVIPERLEQSRFAVDILVVMQGRGGGDLDNYIKSILDGLNGVAWKDDRQVSFIMARMRRGEEDFTRVTLSLLPSWNVTEEYETRLLSRYRTGR